METLQVVKDPDAFISTVARTAKELEDETNPYPICSMVFNVGAAVAMYFGPFHDYNLKLDNRSFRIQEDGSVSIRFKKDDNYDCVPACDLEKKIKDAVEADGKATVISIVPYYIPNAPGNESKQYIVYVMVSDDAIIKSIMRTEYNDKRKLLIDGKNGEGGVLAKQVEEIKAKSTPEQYEAIIDKFVGDQVFKPPFIRHFPTSLIKQPGMFERLFDKPCRIDFIKKEK